ncbi:hypothetical protein MRS44_017556 [Fusarium solani]|uniref:uncharacterized protein n=1 Tax=Fusarium solani TaxID=169388 RepID=UPI0032C406D6|nr:hypothetical protein MRS44_017556 [Fusarium solani]
MNPIEGPRCFPDDALPPECDYNSLEELRAAINAWAAPRGYAFVTQKSWKTSSKRTGVIFGCDRGGRPPRPKKRQRQTTSRRTECLFSVIAMESLCKTTWSVRHRSKPDFGRHNHEPSLSQLAHPTHRQLSSSDRTTVQQLANAGVAPKEISSYLRTNSDSLATQRDIYNCIARGKRELAKGQSNMHALANELENQGFWSQIRLDETGRAIAVLFAHPKSLGYVKLYPEALILDCTYKTNKYGMPQLDVVGVDACQRSFCIAFAFLSGEEEGDFIWALERLRYINPQGLEEWKKFYDSWHEIVASTTEDIYNERLEKFKERYLANYVDEVGYIIETWLAPHKERFVKAWVNQHLHFEQFVTSRAEGIHRLIKTYLKTSQVDLFEAWRVINLVLLNQLAEIEATQARQQITTPLQLSGSLYSNIRGWISHDALRKVEAQRERLSAEYPACTGVFTKTLGLPCAHTLQLLQVQDQPLLLHHFHSHWHLKRSGSPQLLIEPRKQFDRLTASSTLRPTSTQREPCAFEAIEKAVQPKAPPKCSKCGEVGHTMRSKACPLRYEHLLPASTETATTMHTTTHTSTRSMTRSLSPGSPSGASIVSETITITHTTTHTTTRVLSPSAAKPAAAKEAPVLRANDPRAIYQRYKESREACKADYDWCLDYKQMGRHCKAGRSIRDWTKEEMMSYLDWDKAENERVEQNVGIEMAEQPFSGRRGMQEIWDAAERDLEVQERWYGNGNPPN